MPSTSKSNSTSTYSTQQTGQSSAPAFVPADFSNEFLSKLFRPSLYLSQISVVNHCFSEISYAAAEGFRAHRADLGEFCEVFFDKSSFCIFVASRGASPSGRDKESNIFAG